MDALVLTGPVSGGKSRLLGAVVARLQALPRPPLVVSIDCRAGDYISAVDFARALQLRALEATLGSWRLPGRLAWLLPLAQRVLPLLGVKASAASGGLNFSFALQRMLQGALPMEDVLAIYQRAIAASGDLPPVFIVVRSRHCLRTLEQSNDQRLCARPTG